MEEQTERHEPGQTQERYSELENDLKQFVHEAWQILEPVTDLKWNWHLGLICDYLKLIRDEEFKTALRQECEGIIFNVPPRTMKSLLITVMFPVWVWTTKPAKRFMFVSYAEKLSEQHSLLRRTLIRSEWYQERWGKKFRLSKDQNEKNHYENSARGQMFSTAIQATATGMGGDILIFDDPLNPDQALSEKERTTVNFRFDFTFRSRLNDPAKGVKIIVMQRLHELDLTGHVLRRDAKRWKHIKLPAIAEKDESVERPDGTIAQHWRAGEMLWPDRLPQSYLEAMKTGMGAWAFAGQYQQNPSPLEGGLLKRNWIRYYKGFRFKASPRGGTHTGTGLTDWPFVYGHIATATGWTFAEIDQLTLWDVEELFGYWKEYPPVHILVNAYFEGMGSRTRKKQNLKQVEALAEVKRAVVSAGGAVKKGLPDEYRSS